MWLMLSFLWSWLSLVTINADAFDATSGLLSCSAVHCATDTNIALHVCCCADGSAYMTSIDKNQSVQRIILADAADCVVSRLSQLMQPHVNKGTAELAGFKLMNLVQSMELVHRLKAEKVCDTVWHYSEQHLPRSPYRGASRTSKHCECGQAE